MPTYADSIPRPFVVVARRWFVIERKAVDATRAVPIDINVTGVAVHETAYTRSVTILTDWLWIVPTNSHASGDFPSERRFLRFAYRGELLWGHAKIVGRTGHTVESIAGIIRQRQAVEGRIRRTNEHRIVGRRNG